MLSLRHGLQAALWTLGGVPAKLQTDHSSTATRVLHRTTGERGFNVEYLALCPHLGLEPCTINPACPHENGTSNRPTGNAGTAQLRHAHRGNVSTHHIRRGARGGERMSASGSLAGPLRSLMLMTMAREHEDILAPAEAENWGYRRFLAYLVENEVNERLRRRIERQLKESGLPPGKTRGSRGFACKCELDRAASPVACVKRLALALLVAAQTTASAILDRLLHRAQTVVIEGKSYRMKDRLSDEAPA